MNNNENKQPVDQEEEKGYVPASPVKRAMAWIGIVYMLIIVALTTYIYYTGSALGNLGPLLAIPGLVGLGIVSILSWRTTGRPGKWPAIALAVICWIFAAVSIPLGIVGLMSNFGVVGVLLSGG